MWPEVTLIKVHWSTLRLAWSHEWPEIKASWGFGMNNLENVVALTPSVMETARAPSTPLRVTLLPSDLSWYMGMSCVKHMAMSFRMCVIEFISHVWSGLAPAPVFYRRIWKRIGSCLSHSPRAVEDELYSGSDGFCSCVVQLPQAYWNAGFLHAS